VRVAFLNPPIAGATAATANEAGVFVPADAVRAEGTAGVVFVYANDRVERRTVTLGRSAGGNRLVVSGLRDGERVVVSPPDTLKDGATVRVADKS